MNIYKRRHSAKCIRCFSRLPLTRLIELSRLSAAAIVALFLLGTRMPAQKDANCPQMARAITLAIRRDA